MSGAISGRTRVAAVIGDPVRHSLSPAIHNAAFRALDLDWVYLALHVRAGDAAAAIAGMRALGIDATFYFALQRRGGSLRQSDLEIDSPYNTRENAGLVPGPIAMPRRASIEAALNPEPGPWLYYVLQDPTAHFFTDDYDEFLRAKDEAERNGLIP